MQVTSLLSNQSGPGCSDCGHDHGGLDHSHTNVKLTQTLLGLIFVLNSFLVDWVFQRGTTVAGLSAMVGAVILGFPILKVAFLDLKRGLLSINELVALGVLASAASGDFRTAGIVAFFMLLGEIIETRTAAGARASIESLIKLTPTKARRLVDGREEEVPASDLKVDDVICIRPGDSIAADGVIVGMGGYFGTSLAVKTGGTGDVTATHRLWQTVRTKNRLGTGVIAGGHVFILNTEGIAECLNLQTGASLWQERVKGTGSKGDSWSSMVLVDGHILCLNQGGETLVLKASPKFEMVRVNPLNGALVNSSHAISNGEIFIRTQKHLWCIGRP